MTKFFTAIILILVLGGCRTCPQVSSSVQDSNIEYRNRTARDVIFRTDSIHVHDSIFTLIRGDTVLMTRHHTEYRDRVRVDTILRTDTVTAYITRTQRVTVAEKKRPWYVYLIGPAISILVLFGLKWFVFRK